MDLFGTDIASSGGDIGQNAQGDMDTVSGPENLTARLRRRFETPYGSLFYDSTYGNKLYARLSQPMGRSFEQGAISDATECLMGDRMVQSVKATVSIDREKRIGHFQMGYVAKDGTAGSFEKGVSLRV